MWANLGAGIQLRPILAADYIGSRWMMRSWEVSLGGVEYVRQRGETSVIGEVSSCGVSTHGCEAGALFKVPRPFGRASGADAAPGIRYRSESVDQVKMSNVPCAPSIPPTTAIRWGVAWRRAWAIVRKSTYLRYLRPAAAFIRTLMVRWCAVRVTTRVACRRLSTAGETKPFSTSYSITCQVGAVPGVAVDDGAPCLRACRNRRRRGPCGRWWPG